MYWTIILTILVGLLFIYIYFTWKNYFEKYGIPHEKPLPVFGNMASVIFQRIGFVEYLSNLYNLNTEAKYVGCYDSTHPAIMIRDLDLLKSIAIRHFDHFTDHHSFTDPKMDRLLNYNLLCLRGDEWRSIRSLLTPAFTTSKMRTMFQLMSKCAKAFNESLIKQCYENKSYEYDSKDIFTRYINDAIAACLFGISINSMEYPDNEFYSIVKQATNFQGSTILKYYINRVFPKLAKISGMKLYDSKAEKFFDNLIRETIASRDEQGIYRSDMIQLMMETRGNKEDSKKPELSIEKMTSQVLMYFLAGFDFTTKLMSFTIYLLSIHSKIRQKLQDEIDEVMNKYEGEPPYEAVSNMEYIDAVINETLRLFPEAVITDRICTKNFELPPAVPGGKSLMLKPGDYIWFGIWPLHRDPKHFPNPDTFSPERFIGDAKTKNNFDAFLPFGLGPRKCIGYKFVLLETKVLILHALTKFNITPGKKMILPMRLRKPAVILEVAGGFWLNFEPKQAGD